MLLDAVGDNIFGLLKDRENWVATYDGWANPLVQVSVTLSETDGHGATYTFEVFHLGQSVKKSPPYKDAEKRDREAAKEACLFVCGLTEANDNPRHRDWATKDTPLCLTALTDIPEMAWITGQWWWPWLRNRYMNAMKAAVLAESFNKEAASEHDFFLRAFWACLYDLCNSSTRQRVWPCAERTSSWRQTGLAAKNSSHPSTPVAQPESLWDTGHWPWVFDWWRDALTEWEQEDEIALDFNYYHNDLAHESDVAGTLPRYEFPNIDYSLLATTHYQQSKPGLFP